MWGSAIADRSGLGSFSRLSRSRGLPSTGGAPRRAARRRLWDRVGDHGLGGAKRWEHDDDDSPTERRARHHTTQINAEAWDRKVIRTCSTRATALDLSVSSTREPRPCPGRTGPAPATDAIGLHVPAGSVHDRPHDTTADASAARYHSLRDWGGSKIIRRSLGRCVGSHAEHLPFWNDAMKRSIIHRRNGIENRPAASPNDRQSSRATAVRSAHGTVLGDRGGA